MEETKEYKIEKSPETRQTERLLRSYPHMLDDIQKLNEELCRTLEQKNFTQDTLKATKINDMPKSGNLSDSTYEAVEKSIDKHDEHIKYLVAQIEILYSDRKSIREATKILTMEEYRIIDYRYFKGMRLERISGIMHYHRTHCERIIKHGLQKIISALGESNNV
jgi:predicted DNA-binding protein (UPF0251 family)